MNSVTLTIFFVATAFPLQSSTRPVAAQKTSSWASFQGSWHGERYLTEVELRKSDIKQLKRWAEGMNIRKTPIETLQMDLILKQDKLTGTCSSAMRFGARLDDCGFSTRIKGDVAQFTVESSHGSRVTVSLTRKGDRLYWRILKSDLQGEYWFPDRAILKRSRTFTRPKPIGAHGRRQRNHPT